MFILLSIVGFFIAITVFWTIFALLDHRRLLKASSAFYSLPKLPLIGHFHLFPKCTYDMTDFLISHSNEAIRRGQNMMIWWFATDLNIWMLDAESTKAILENAVELTKSSDYDFFLPWMGEGLLLSDGANWRGQRRMLTPTFHFAMLEQYTHIFNRKAHQLVNKLAALELNQAQNEDGTTSAASKDIAPMLTRFALDIAAEAIMGVKLDSSEQSDSAEYVKAVGNFQHFHHKYVMNPIYYFSPIAWYLFGNGFATRKCLKTLKTFTRTVIEERIKLRKSVQRNEQSDENGLKLSSTKKGRAFLDLLLELEEEGMLDREQLREQVDTFMFAGHDTTAHGLIWTLWCLACHPQCQQRIHAEIVEKFGANSNVDDDNDGWELSATEANELRYLDRCVREALRLLPAVPLVGRQLQNDLVIDGKTLPRGAVVAVSPILVHHNEKVYPNHWEFNPDNFLPEELAKRSAFDYIPFSAGPRNCIGQRFAMLELKILLAHIFCHFHFSTNLPFRQNRPELSPILRPEHGLPICIHKRSE